MERVESEVVLICEGKKNKEGVCDMLCFDVKMKRFYDGTQRFKWS